MIHLRRYAPGFISRFKKGLLFGGKTLLATIGIAGSIITALAATGNTLSFLVIFYTGLGCLILSFSATILKGHLEHLPEQIIIEECMDGQYIVEYCSSETLREANHLTRPYYRYEYVSDNVAELWRQKNPKGFVHILNSSHELCACFGIIGVETSFMIHFIKDRLVDNDLLDEDVLDILSTKKSPSLYISGVVVRDPDSPAGHIRACIMIWAILKYINKVFGVRKKRTIYALAVSKTSENLLKKCSFTISSSTRSRKDKLNLYSLEPKKQMGNLETWY